MAHIWGDARARHLTPKDICDFSCHRFNRANFLCVTVCAFQSSGGSGVIISLLRLSVPHSTNTLETGSQSQPLHISKHEKRAPKPFTRSLLTLRYQYSMIYSKIGSLKVLVHFVFPCTDSQC